MMANNFNAALFFVLEHEGGYVNDPKDPGGETNMGISKRAYPGEDIRGMTKSWAAEIYRREYWDKCRCDDLPDGIDLHVFDMAVNAGPSRAATLLQAVVGASIDGVIGPNTLRAVTQSGDFGGLIEIYERARITFYQSLRTWDRFGRGWTNRAKDATVAARAMIGRYDD